MRNGENRLRAFYNLCRHLGARLCAGDDAGESLIKGGVSGKFITWPCHAWTYDLDGQLIRARDIPEDCEFNTGDIQLHPVAVDAWGGFIFIHMTPGKARSLSEHVALVSGRFRRYRIEDLRIAKTLRYTVEANWKVVCENGGAGLEWDKGVPHREGAITFTATGTTNRRTNPGLNEDEQTRHFGELVYPNLFLSLSSDHVAVFTLHADGPNRTQVDCHLLFEPYEMERAEFNPAYAADFGDLGSLPDILKSQVFNAVG